MITHKQYYDALSIVRQYKDQVIKEVSQVEKDANIMTVKVSNLKRFQGVTSETKLKDADISTRLWSTIMIRLDEVEYQNRFEMKVSELSKISISELRNYRNVGQKTIQELIELCQCANVKLKE